MGNRDEYGITHRYQSVDTNPDQSDDTRTHWEMTNDNIERGNRVEDWKRYIDRDSKRRIKRQNRDSRAMRQAIQGPPQNRSVPASQFINPYA